jgi:hypothetical protein
MRARIDDIDKEQKLTIHELRHLYRNNVCGTICDFALNIMSIMELRRHVARGIYREAIKFKKRQRTTVIYKISLLVGLSVRTIEKLCPSPKQNIKNDTE